MAEWYQFEAQEVLNNLDVEPVNGLNDPEVILRQEKYGRNELIEKGLKSPWLILWEQLTGIMVVILIVSAVISLILGEITDTIVILIIVVLNAVLGFTQEYRAEQAMAALKKMAVPNVRVRRGRHITEVSAIELVPGDIVMLEAGSAVPADCRIIENANLRVQESILTGESEPVEKRVDRLDDHNIQVGDRKNMLFMGTVVTYGRGQAVVVETGMDTELGHIAEMIQTVRSEATPLQRRLEQLGKGLALAALGVVTVVFILGILQGEDIRLMFQTAISMAVAAVPEGLPAVVTIALALGAQRMLQRRALIRKLPAVETLGSVTVICSDKTGTLTENRMTVTVLDVAENRLDLLDYSPSSSTIDSSTLLENDNPAISLLLLAGTMCNDAELEPSQESGDTYSTIGDPTEGAIIVAAARTGIWKNQLTNAFPRVSELPFESDRKRMSTVHRCHPDRLSDPLKNILNLCLAGEPLDEYLVFTKGAVDSLLEVTSHVWVNGRLEELDDFWMDRILTANNRMAEDGMRVLGVAFRNRDTSKIDENYDPLESNLTVIGLIGMIDPARPEVRDAVSTSKKAGIRPIMITGDHPLTARHIARELGIARKDDLVMTGKDLTYRTMAELERDVQSVSVFARVSPEHKLMIVQALQNQGQIVAMTGDGVNDAPALKKADIGVAMGITGTDVSKEAADMVLLDDNFATIVAAVEEGRRIYDNIRKFIKYTMTSNAGEIWVMLLAPILGMPFPLTPLQILWVNLVTDGLPGLALTVEPAEMDIMERPPFHPKENIFGRGMGRDILWIGLLMGAISLGIGYWFWGSGLASWQTMVFTTLTIAQMGNALASRSNHDSLFKIGLFSNLLLLGSVIITLILQAAVIYNPFLQNIFNTVALTPIEIIISFIASAVVLASIEIVKWIRRRSF
jgi:P-type Ca2+ transporter type 2C